MSLRAAAAAVRELTTALAGLSATAGGLGTDAVVELRIRGAETSDRARATALRRQQTPEELAALRKALGLL